MFIRLFKIIILVNSVGYLTVLWVSHCFCKNHMTCKIDIFALHKGVSNKNVIGAIIIHRNKFETSKVHKRFSKLPFPDS